MEAGTSGVLSICDSGRRVPAEYGEESHASSSVEEWMSPQLHFTQSDDKTLNSCKQERMLVGYYDK